ncbi:MAG: hydrogenase expression/formation protein HypE [Bernardetiaceae bacterium]|jgi:hydrogenase expression/formation protein HypE|nr:hydrogenase expression/formation protein HypE [Bernardetiaceae bacterium]
MADFNQLQCPLPQLDFDVITLGHGSGGLLTHQLLASGVFDLLRNPLLDTQHDGAVLPTSGPVAFSTDSYVVSPLFFPGGNIGDLAVNGTVNDLAMCGALPRYLSLSFILEEGLPVTEFWAVLVSIKQAVERAGVLVVTGDTKVVEKGKGDRIYINTSGLGPLHPRAQVGAAHIRPGDQLIVSGPLATHGMAIMSVREGLAFEADLTSDTAALHHTVAALLDDFGPAIRFLRDPTRGGLGTTLNEVARQTKLGVALDQKSLPILPQVENACELLGLDPLYVANEGVFMAAVDPEVAPAFLARLHQLPHGAAAASVGHFTPQHPGQVVLSSRIGGRRVVGMLPGEQLPRIC